TIPRRLSSSRVCRTDRVPRPYRAIGRRLTGPSRLLPSGRRLWNDGYAHILRGLETHVVGHHAQDIGTWLAEGRLHRKHPVSGDRRRDIVRGVDPDNLLRFESHRAGAPIDKPTHPQAVHLPAPSPTRRLRIRRWDSVIAR